MNSSLLPQAILSGLMLAAIYTLVALGLTLVFGLLDIVNFAQGQLLVLGAYLTVAISGQGFGYFIALALAVTGAAVIGYLLDVGLFARVRREPINGLLLSVGIIAVFQTVFFKVWGPNSHPPADPVNLTVHIGGTTLQGSRLMLIGITLVVLVALAGFLRHTVTGKALRATAQHGDAALLMGIPTERVRHLAFAVSAALAALAGGLFAMVFSFDPLAGDGPLIKGFIVLLIGGAGSPAGAVAAGLLLGLVESLGITYWSAGATELLEFGVLIAVLFVRPQGIVRAVRETTL
jgi:branched-chain amino acid transport system permease protein